jgi:hypothetical protein
MASEKINGKDMKESVPGVICAIIQADVCRAVACVGEKNNVYGILVGKPEEKRSFQRSGC